MRGIFVTGTDTNVGKTVVAAATMLRYRDEAPLRYWKPIQTGIRESGFGIRTPDGSSFNDDDTSEVARLSRALEDEIFARGIRLPDPVSPHLAAQRAGTRTTVRELVAMVWKASHVSHADSRTPNPESRVPSPECRTRWIVEGAGGALVPVNERETMADLMQALDLPVLVVARSALGTINHTCMTIEVLRRRRLRVAGVVMVGDRNEENRLAIEKYGAAEVVGQMPWFDPLTPEALETWARAEFDRSGVLFVGGLR
jgi:dethiobiotin synthetase